MACGRKPRPRRKVAKAMKKGNFKRIIVGLGVEMALRPANPNEALQK
jgi:hypothetical protein